MQIKCVAVYLGSKTGNSPVFVESATALGKALAENGIAIVYGGTNVGTMNALANGAISAKGKITGVIPEKFAGRSIGHDKISQLILSKDLKERKSIMEKMSGAAIILPGSYGTMDELFEYATNNQLENLGRPIFLLNTEGFYNPLVEQLENMVKYGFLPPELFSMIRVCSNIGEIIENILNFK